MPADRKHNFVGEAAGKRLFLNCRIAQETDMGLISADFGNYRNARKFRINMEEAKQQYHKLIARLPLHKPF